MSIITKEEIEKLAELARLKLTAEEADKFQKEIESILSYVKQVQEVQVSVEEDSSPGGVFSFLQNRLREDNDPYNGGDFTKEILEEAPRREGNLFKVKKIL